MTDISPVDHDYHIRPLIRDPGPDSKGGPGQNKTRSYGLRRPGLLRLGPLASTALSTPLAKPPTRTPRWDRATDLARVIVTPGVPGASPGPRGREAFAGPLSADREGSGRRLFWGLLGVCVQQTY